MNKPKSADNQIIEDKTLVKFDVIGRVDYILL